MKRKYVFGSLFCLVLVIAGIGAVYVGSELVLAFTVGVGVVGFALWFIFVPPPQTPLEPSVRSLGVPAEHLIYYRCADCQKLGSALCLRGSSSPQDLPCPEIELNRDRPMFSDPTIITG